jgi:predicted O-methyltransferase YrrM
MNIPYIYQKLKKNYLNFLPDSPVSTITKKIGINDNLLESRYKKDLNKFPDEIKKILIDIREETGQFLMNKSFKNLGDILNHLIDTEKIEGNIIEFGTYKGQTTVFIAKALEKIHSQKKIFSCDTFQGIPYEDKFSTNKTAKGSFSDTSYESVQKTFDNFKVSNKIQIVKGKFEDVVENNLKNQKFSYVFVDCDVYDASVFSLNFGFPRLTKNGIISFDDYERDNRLEARWGMTKAVDDYCEKHKINLMLDNSEYEKLPYIKKD